MSIATPPADDLADLQETFSDNPGLMPFFDNLESFVELPEGVEKLRELFLRLAVSGKLLRQASEDEPASSILEKFQARWADEGGEKRSRHKAIPPIVDVEIEVPTNWARARLGNVFEFEYGQSLPKKARVTSGKVPVYGSNGPVGVHNEAFVEVPSIVIGRKGSSGAVNLVSDPFWPIDTTYFVTPSSGMDLMFSVYLLKSLRLDELGSSIVPGLNRDDAYALPVLIPPEAEQRRIVAKVESLMALCDTLEEQRRARESCRQRATRSVLASLTSAPRADANPQPDHNSNGQSNPPGETLASAWQRLSDHFEVLLDQPESLTQLRQSILQLAVQGKLVPQNTSDKCVDKAIAESREAVGMKKVEIEAIEGEFDIPANWRWVTVHDVAEHRLGKMLDKAKNTGNPQPYLRNTNVHWFRFDLSSLKNMLFEDDELEEFEVRRGDLLICEGGHGIARTAVWECKIDRVMFQKALHRVRPLECLDSYFLAFCLRVYEATGILQRYYTGAGIPHFTGRSLAKVEFPLAPVSEQKRIVSKVSALLSQLDELSTQLQKRQYTTEELLTSLIHRILGENR